MQTAYLSPKQAAEVFPGKVSPSTVISRCTSGVHGVYLKHLYDGHRYWTTEEWIGDFLRDCTRKHLESPIVPHHQQASQAKADRERFTLKYGSKRKLAG